MIIKRQKSFSEKKNKESLYRRYVRWFDKKVDNGREKSKKRLENMKDGSAKDFLTDLQDSKRNRFYYITESERQKGFSEPSKEDLLKVVDQNSLRSVAKNLNIPFDKFKKELKIVKTDKTWEIYHPKSRMQWGVGTLNGKLCYAGAID